MQVQRNAQILFPAHKPSNFPPSLPPNNSLPASPVSRATVAGPFQKFPKHLTPRKPRKETTGTEPTKTREPRPVLGRLRGPGNKESYEARGQLLAMWRTGKVLCGALSACPLPRLPGPLEAALPWELPCDSSSTPLVRSSCAEPHGSSCPLFEIGVGCPGTSVVFSSCHVVI